jgi:hypothetical protein
MEPRGSGAKSGASGAIEAMSIPDFASLHPGYGSYSALMFSSRISRAYRSDWRAMCAPNSAPHLGLG